MTRKAVSLPELTMDRLHDLMAGRLATLADDERGRAERAGMATWLEEVAESIERDGIHPHLIFALPAPDVGQRKRGQRIDPRSLVIVVLLARGPAAGLGLDVPDGEIYGEVLRVRVRDLVLRDGTRVDTAATVREVLAQTRIEIPDDIGPMLDAWDREEGQA
jgi:hypothetical protein